MRRAFYLQSLPVLFLLSGCTTIDFDYPRAESMTITDTEETRLGNRIAELWPALAEGKSGFYPLSDGIEALSARLLLAERADVSIDTQYYLVKTDNAEEIKVHKCDKALASISFQTMLDRSERYTALIDKLQMERGISCMHIGATE